MIHKINDDVLRTFVETFRMLSIKFDLFNTLDSSRYIINFFNTMKM